MTWAKPLKLKDKAKMKGGGQNISQFSGFLREREQEGEKENPGFPSTIHEVPLVGIRLAKN